MSRMNKLSRTVRKVRQFCKQFETQAALPSHEITGVTLSEVLFDVCQLLGLTRQQTKRVLGRKNSMQLRTYRRFRPTLRE